MTPRPRVTPRGPIDWVEIRRRMAAIGHALADETTITPERSREILEARARALAKVPPAPSVAAMLQLLTFSLSREVYAFESRYVVEVFRLKDLSLLPGAEAPVFGVTAWRGELLTIVDLRPVLGLPSTALNDLGWVIVLGVDRPAFGVLADTILDFVDFPAAALQLPSDNNGATREYLRGITPAAVLVLEASRLLALMEPDFALPLET